MHSIDIIFLTILGFFAFLGIWRGFFREVLGFVGVVGGIFLGIVRFGPISRVLSQHLPDIPAALWPFLSFFLIFVSFYLLSRFLAAFLSKVFQSIYLGWLNRLLGGVVGAFKGAVLISLILLLVGFLPFQKSLQQVREKSLLYNSLQRVIPVLYNLSTGAKGDPAHFEKKITAALKKGQVKLNQAIIDYLFYGKQDSDKTTE